MSETAPDGSGHAMHPSTPKPRRATRTVAAHPTGVTDLVAAWSSLGVCVVGTHDAAQAADAWNALIARRHASLERRTDAELDASAWWHAQRRWARFGHRGWAIVRDRDGDAQPVLLLLGVYRD